MQTAPQGQLEATVETWIREHFLARSPVALRYGVRVARLPAGAVLKYGDPDVLFFNVNTPEELESAMRHA